MKYRKKPIIIEATQWFKNGDHPKDNSSPMYSEKVGHFLSEGKVVRRYRRPAIEGWVVCSNCRDEIMKYHGWIDRSGGGMIYCPDEGYVVCPEDWIITEESGEYYPCKPDIFEKMYEPVV